MTSSDTPLNLPASFVVAKGDCFASVCGGLRDYYRRQVAENPDWIQLGTFFRNETFCCYLLFDGVLDDSLDSEVLQPYKNRFLSLDSNGILNVASTLHMRWAIERFVIEQEEPIVALGALQQREKCNLAAFGQNQTIVGEWVAQLEFLAEVPMRRCTATYRAIAPLLGLPPHEWWRHMHAFEFLLLKLAPTHKLMSNDINRQVIENALGDG